jgi:hypothetical protein
MNKLSVIAALVWLGLGLACACWGEWWLARGCAAVALLAVGLGIYQGKVERRGHRRDAGAEVRVVSDDLRELAEAAQAKAGGPIDWDTLVKRSLESYAMMKRLMEATFAASDVWESYAEALGKGELTEAEKKQAILDAVLEQVEGLDNLRKIW